MTDLLNQLNSIWSQLLELLSRFVIPDWGGLINLFPVLVLIGVVGPLLTLLVLAWFVYAVRAPRPRVRLAEGPERIPLDPDGRPVVRPGLPYCRRDLLAFAGNATRCTECGDDLAVICPMCGLGRPATIATCGNCGLVLQVEPRVRVLRPAGPPPGGAAIA